VFLASQGVDFGPVCFYRSPSHARRAAIAQLVRALDCGSRGPPFEPGWWYHFLSESELGCRGNPERAASATSQQFTATDRSRARHHGSRLWTEWADPLAAKRQTHRAGFRTTPPTVGVKTWGTRPTSGHSQGADHWHALTETRPIVRAGRSGDVSSGFGRSACGQAVSAGSNTRSDIEFRIGAVSVDHQGTAPCSK
jgi:hypothetical protein